MAPGSKRRKLSNGSYDANSPETELGKSSKEERNRSLFVRSLPASVTNEKLAEHFSQSYPLKHATIVLDPKTKISRGFGFVTFTDADDARAAAEEFNETVIDGRKIKVEIAEARHREVADNITGKVHSVNVKGEELRAKRQQQQQEKQPPKLIVRNLPWSVKTADDLTKLFLSYGKVKHAVVPKLPAKQNAQAGFGIVILRGKKNAEKALEGVNGKVVDGRTLAVDWAVDKETWAQAQQSELVDVASKDEVNADIAHDALDTNADETSSEGLSMDEGAAILDNDDLHDTEEEMKDFSEGDLASETDEEADGTQALDDPSEGVSTTTTGFNTENTTIFVRNLPFSTDDESLFAHFKTNFGPVRYARVVYDPETEYSRGTAFVCFRHESDAKECVKNSPKSDEPNDASYSKDKKRKGETMQHSVLQNEAQDPSGKYTLEGRVLQISRALSKSEADRRTDENSKEREKRANDKRRLYLLNEGTVSPGSKLYNTLGKAELDIRQASAKQRQKLVKQNPNLGFSLTRLSVRNMPRWIDSKSLKQMAREAVVEFAKDMKEGKRQPLSREEIARDGETEREAEKKRREKGKGLVKQAKIVYESDITGGKVAEGKGGRSRGYGFIEYYGHRNALMGLRWLNGHLVKGKGGDGQDRGKRLIVEFALENAQVVQRRNDRERRSTDAKGRDFADKKRKFDDRSNEPARPEKRKKGQAQNDTTASEQSVNQDEKNKTAMRNRIIAQKRQKRRGRKGKA